MTDSSPLLASNHRLHEVVLAELHTPHDMTIRTPKLEPDDDDQVSIELVDDADDIAVTGRFVRFSAPYERVDIAPLRNSFRWQRPRATTFARTVHRPNGLDAAWFDPPADALAMIDDTELVARRATWWWLAISLAVAAVVLAVIV